jgi:hypothetical protein
MSGLTMPEKNMPGKCADGIIPALGRIRPEMPALTKKKKPDPVRNDRQFINF